MAGRSADRDPLRGALAVGLDAEYPIQLAILAVQLDAFDGPRDALQSDRASRVFTDLGLPDEAVGNLAHGGLSREVGGAHQGQSGNEGDGAEQTHGTNSENEVVIRVAI